MVGVVQKRALCVGIIVLLKRILVYELAARTCEVEPDDLLHVYFARSAVYYLKALALRRH
jgi:hypothetical protein